MERNLASGMILTLLIGMLTLVSNVQPVKAVSTCDAESLAPPPPPPSPPSDPVIPIDIGLYWDEECTNPISVIDFGILAKGQGRYVTFWLRNKRSDKGRISWRSANFYPSSNGIAESWERTVGRFACVSNWNKKMKTGDLWEVRYTIQMAQDIQVDVYSWDLIVCYVISHRIICLSIPCILIVTQ